MRRFPAFVWLSTRPALAGGFQAFQRVRKRRANEPKFSDDCAHFRYWTFASDAVTVLNMRQAPQPAAEQRRQAIAAALKLQELIAQTSLLSAAGIEYRQGQALAETLERIRGLETQARRKRVDAYSEDREYVRMLALIAHCEFGDAPPAVICEVAALKVRNPDKVAITKQVSEFKKGRALA